MDWIDLAQDRDRWRAVWNSVMNLRIQFKKRGISLLAEDLLAFLLREFRFYSSVFV